MKKLVEMQFGSQLYGTATPTSDVDLKSVFVPLGRDILLQRAPQNIQLKRHKAHGEKNLPGEVDEESFALHRYLQLLSQGQTVALDMLFAPPSAFVCEASDTWEVIMANRSKLVCKKSASFVGYCRTQANKYGIRGSRIDDLNKVIEFLSGFPVLDRNGVRFGDIQDLLREVIKDLKHTSIVNLPHPNRPDVPNLHLECCGRKAPFTLSFTEARKIFQRALDGYGDRALQAQRNENIDWKAISHALRVGYEALELFGTGAITFPLPYAADILRVKQGLRPYQEVAEELESLLDEIDRAAERSSLPDSVDHGFIDNLVTDTYRKAVV